jgi:hypothetical protein
MDFDRHDGFRDLPSGDGEWPGPPGEEPDLDDVRRRLDALVARRLSRPLSFEEELRWLHLVAVEEELLGLRHLRAVRDLPGSA